MKNKFYYGVSMYIVPLLFLLMLSIQALCQSSSSIDDLLTRLGNKSTANTAADELIAMGTTSAAVRETLSARLPQMILFADSHIEGVSQIEPDGKELLIDMGYEIIQAEAKVVGKLQIAAASSVLAELLAHYNCECRTASLSDPYQFQQDGVARALYEIGEPALPALAVALENPVKIARDRAMKVLLTMDTVSSRKLLQDHCPREPDLYLKSYWKGCVVTNGASSPH